MEKVTKIAEVKKVYTIFSDSETRGFFASLRRLRKDCEDAEAAKQAEAAEAAVKCAMDAAKAAAKRAKDLQRAAQKDAAKAEAAAEAQKAAEAAAEAVTIAQKDAAIAVQKAAEAKKRESAESALASLAEVMQRKQLKSEDITKDFLLEYLPQKFNAAQQICSIKKVDAAEAEAVREEFAKKDLTQLLEERESELYICKPISLFTANTFLSLFCSAAAERSKQQKEASSAAEKEAKAKASAEREAKRIAEYRRKIAEFEAKQQKAKK